MSFVANPKPQSEKDSCHFDDVGLMEDRRCRVCFQHSKTVKHLVDGCQKLANSEYLSRHNRALMILAIAWAKEHGLIGQDMV